MSDLQNDVRRRLRTRLKAAGWSDARVGELLGIDRTQVGRFLKDPAVSITLDRIERLSQALNLQPIELMVPEDAEVQALSPVELGVLNRLREMTAEQRFALVILLDWQQGKLMRIARSRQPLPSDLSQSGLAIAQRWQAASPTAQKLVTDLLGFGEDTKLQIVNTDAAPASDDENPGATQTLPHQR